MYAVPLATVSFTTETPSFFLRNVLDLAELAFAISVGDDHANFA